MTAATLAIPFPCQLMAEPRIDGYLSGKAAARIDGALVVVRNEDTDAEEWALTIPGRNELRLGHDHKRARMALRHLLDHLKAGGELPE